ncbi:NfeD family protein [Kutzneria sp. NPDC052558]|uniref:NfeD family protein n=1 Tax=Kutzneria sp. NPDC052558 TaxID=3364121 RepID=UPI0037C8AA94
MAAVLWLLFGVALVLAEVLSGDFVLVMLGVGGLAAALADVVGGSLLADAIVFAATTLVGLFAVRPILRSRLMAGGHDHRTGIEALKGVQAVVVSTVDEHDGRVRINGEVWSARTFEPTQRLEPGRQVIVMDISGATAIVWAEN